MLRQLPKRLFEAVVGDLEVVSRLHFNECRIVVRIVLNASDETRGFIGARSLVRHRARKDCDVAHRAAYFAEVEVLESGLLELELKSIRIEPFLASDTA